MPDLPIITVDGPSGSGKGTVAARLAEHFGWHLLDSGALYRLTGYAAEQAGIDLTDAAEVAQIAADLEVEFLPDKILLGGQNVSLAIRTETVGNAASKVAAIPAVRSALLDWQQGCARAPGLIADGRDMGTVVFPNACLKIFLTASAEERARRRYKQLKEKGIAASVAMLIEEIRERDERDCNRATAPLQPAGEALHIDSTQMSIEAVVETIIHAADSLVANHTHRE